MTTKLFHRWAKPSENFDKQGIDHGVRPWWGGDDPSPAGGPPVTF